MGAGRLAVQVAVAQALCCPGAVACDCPECARAGAQPQAGLRAKDSDGPAPVGGPELTGNMAEVTVGIIIRVHGMTHAPELEGAFKLWTRTTAPAPAGCRGPGPLMARRRDARAVPPQGRLSSAEALPVG
jgi:hypothetical protein